MSKQYKLDTIVRKSLQSHALPLHYYFRFLNWAIEGLQEISFDMPINIKSIRRTITDYGAIVVPDDFVDYVRVGEEYADLVEPFVHEPKLNRLNSFDAQGNKQRYPQAQTEAANLYHLYTYEDNYNSNGEYKGRDFAYVGSREYTIKYVPERNEIQLGSRVTGISELQLIYISDGVVTSTANLIHPYAIQTLLTWIRWKRLEHQPRRFRNETAESKARREYYNERRKLKGRLNQLNVDDVIMAGRRGHHAGIKE